VKNGKKFNQIKKMITYWIEVMHIQSAIDELVEDTDEIAEIYEPKNWFMDNQDGNGQSIMDLHVLLEEAATKCDGISRIVDDGFPTLVKMCMKDAPIVFSEFADKVNDSNIDEIIRVFQENVTVHDLYDYCSEEQFENFCMEMRICCLAVINGIPLDELDWYADDFDDFDDDELPFN